MCEDIDNIEKGTFAFHDIFRFHGTDSFLVSLAGIDTLHSRPVIPRHAWIENSTSRIWGTDKRSRLQVSFCTRSVSAKRSLSRRRWLTNGVPPATVCIAARLHPRFQSTHIATILRIKVVCFLRTIVRRWYEREMRLARNETSNDDLLRTTSSKRRFVTS